MIQDFTKSFKVIMYGVAFAVTSCVVFAELFGNEFKWLPKEEVEQASPAMYETSAAFGVCMKAYGGSPMFFPKRARTWTEWFLTDQLKVGMYQRLMSTTSINAKFTVCITDIKLRKI